MPGELSDPTQLFPFHYDKRYDTGKEPFPDTMPDLDEYLQSISAEMTGRQLNRSGMRGLKLYLDGKGMLCRNMGDESFRDEVKKYLKALVMGKKVANRWLTLMG
jgi:hypothetical protein